ncbi:unnamed protein product [Prorocentrum cordatum]|uniref:Pentatricopeptide repeat-containing protein n=1 Tax=Prorocentrum cordatum TaxID=2364126 RepID=A0ABN9XZP8_9DINO|nr:unnamed protein product [Polarella glacialis]
MATVRLTPDVLSYTAVIRAAAATGQVEEALRWRDRALASGVPSDVALHNAAIGACARARRLDLALHALGAMRGARLGPTLVSYTSALSACSGQPGGAEAAEALLRDMGAGALRLDALALGAASRAIGRGRAEAGIRRPPAPS